MVERAKKFYVVRFHGGEMIIQKEYPADTFDWPTSCSTCGEELNITGTKRDGYWVTCPNWTVKAHDLIKIVPIF